MKPRFNHKDGDCSARVQKFGFFIRKSDGRKVQRWRCADCGSTTSDAVKSLAYRQNKRHLNSIIEKMLNSVMSQRRIALVLRISRTTVARKFLFLGGRAQFNNLNWRSKHFAVRSIKEVFIDEMEDRVHTKCKPIAIALAVTKDRKVIDFQISRIRPKNRRLNRISKRKYPNWKRNDREGFSRLIMLIKPHVSESMKVHTDRKLFYADLIEEHFPRCQHLRHESRKAVVAGQGELKEGGRDPLFALNHTCAMLRANINRLIRRTWCTSKTIEGLKNHIEMYIYFHNTVLT